MNSLRQVLRERRGFSPAALSADRASGTASPKHPPKDLLEQAESTAGYPGLESLLLIAEGTKVQHVLTPQTGP